jgi:hypothetical protein
MERTTRCLRETLLPLLPRTASSSRCLPWSAQVSAHLAVQLPVVVHSAQIEKVDAAAAAKDGTAASRQQQQLPLLVYGEDDPVSSGGIAAAAVKDGQQQQVSSLVSSGELAAGCTTNSTIDTTGRPSPFENRQRDRFGLVSPSELATSSTTRGVGCSRHCPRHLCADFQL